MCRLPYGFKILVNQRIIQIKRLRIQKDVEKVAKNLNYDFSDIDATKISKDLYGLRYSEFVVPLVKAMQEPSKMNDVKDSIIQTQNNKIDKLEQRLAKIEALMNVQSSANSNAQ
jgi:hypothetical protein